MHIKRTLGVYLLAGSVACLWLVAPAHSELSGVEKLKAARTAFRVCADPENLPFTNRAGEGFDNKIAGLFAEAEGKPLEYAWWPERRGFIGNTLNRWNCDVVLGVPTGYELTATTRPYYCSAYVEVHRAAQPAPNIWSSSPPPKRIGVVVRTPPLDMLLGHHVEPLVYLPNNEEDNYSGKIIDDVAAGRTDAALVWGPIAGYFVQHEVEKLSMAPLTESPDHDIRLSFPVSMGVRHGDDARLAELNALIEEHQQEIDTILRRYNVPLVEDPVRCATPEREASRSAASPMRAATDPAPTVPARPHETVAQPQMVRSPQVLAGAQEAAGDETPAGDKITCNGTETMQDIQKLGGSPPPALPPPYEVVNGKVGAKTYEGWVRFSAFCQQCHGPGAIGSALAPDLTQAIKTLNHRQFETVVTCGLKGNLGTGVMPAWGENPNISPYIDDLWAYLKARADDALGPGRPEKLETSSPTQDTSAPAVHR